MNLKKFVSGMIETILRYHQYCLKTITPQLFYSTEPELWAALNKRIEEVQAINPLRVSLLQYILSVIKNVKPYASQERPFTPDEIALLSNMLCSFLSNCQRLSNTSKNEHLSLANVVSFRRSWPLDPMPGLRDWSIISGDVLCQSGSIIHELLFAPLKLTKDSDAVSTKTAVDTRLIFKQQKSILSRNTSLVIENLCRENAELRMKNSTLSTKLVELEARLTKVTDDDQAEIPILSSIMNLLGVSTEAKKETPTVSQAQDSVQESAQVEVLPHSSLPMAVRRSAHINHSVFTNHLADTTKDKTLHFNFT